MLTEGIASGSPFCCCESAGAGARARYTAKAIIIEALYRQANAPPMRLSTAVSDLLGSYRRSRDRFSAQGFNAAKARLLKCPWTGEGPREQDRTPPSLSSSTCRKAIRRPPAGRSALPTLPLASAFPSWRPLYLVEELFCCESPGHAQQPGYPGRHERILGSGGLRKPHP